MYDELNKEKSAIETKMIFGFIIIGISFILFIPLGASGGSGAIFILFISFIGGGIIVGINSKKIKQISNNFKKVYVAAELKKIFPDSSYFYDQGFSETEVTNSGLLHHQDRYKSEDLITGSHEGVNFRCCDVKQEDVRSNGKSTTVVTVFQGRFYEFDFPKEFKANLLLLQPYNFRPFSGLTRVKMESVKFNSELKVYAKDEHEAFFILTPQFMEQLLMLDSKYNNKISFSLQNKKLYIALDSRKDYFDIKPFRTVDSSIISEYREELNDIKEFIKVLQLDLTLFKNN